MTWTLCSIPAPEQALREIRRMLKPDGELPFVEHGLAPEPRIAAWQHRLTPFWRRIAGSCRLNLKADDLVSAAGFALTALTTGYMPGPRALAWGAFMYQGRARGAGLL